jgi:hypothetical protein
MRDLSAAPAATFIRSFLALADDGFYFLQNHTSSELQSDNDFNTSMAVARMVLEAADHDPEIMIRAMTEPGEVRMSCFVTFNRLDFPS